MEKKRLFLALEVRAPWPETLPGGRLLDEAHRHMTLVFLGDVEPPRMEDFPSPPFEIGPAGWFDKCLFLPHKHPNVVAWHVSWFEENRLRDYVEQLFRYFELEPRPLLPHVTLARKPFPYAEWREAFSPLPMIVSGLHLYESVGKLKYEPVWSYPVFAPFDELDHTADIAFRVRGTSMRQLHLHAQVAMAFVSPRLLGILPPPMEDPTLDEIVIALNALVTEADTRWGSPFKAVSFSGDVVKHEGILEWEMIVDV